MANTAYPLNHPQTVKIWSTRLFREALKETYISRFMGSTTNDLIYVKKELNKSAGDTIKYGLRMQLSGAGIAGDGTLEGNEESLTTYQDSIVIDQLRHAVRSDGEMTEQRVPFSVREESMDGLRDWWADRLDTAFFNHICGNINAGATYYGANVPTAPTSTASNTRIVYGAGSTSTTASYTATSSNSASIKGITFQLTTIDRVINVAKLATPVIRPIRINGQSKYVMFLHPNAVRQLRQNAAAGAVTWYDIMRARAEGGDVKENPIYNGALGEYNGVILHESVRVQGLTTSNGAMPVDGRVKLNVLCGAQAACFATGRRDNDTQMKWVEELFDYENKLGVSAAMIWGLKKTVFNSIDFGTIVVPSYSQDP